MRFLRLFFFHVKDYLSDQYFIWLTITSTTTIFLTQYTIAYASHNLNNPMLWRQNGIFGMWSSCTTVAGCINFERSKGTLPYLLNNQYDERASLIALLLPASGYGLCAFPLSFCLAKLLGVATGKIDFYLLLTIGLLWLAAAIMGILIASFLTLAQDALVYETLIGTPITTPVATLTRHTNFNWLTYLVSLGLWVGAIDLVVRRVNFLARKKGTLKIL